MKFLNKTINKKLSLIITPHIRVNDKTYGAIAEAGAGAAGTGCVGGVVLLGG